jgi:hypothetical protein
MIWFGPLAGFPLDYGYFHLCPNCYDECVRPDLEAVQEVLEDLARTPMRG